MIALLFAAALSFGLFLLMLGSFTGSLIWMLGVAGLVIYVVIDLITVNWLNMIFKFLLGILSSLLYQLYVANNFEVDGRSFEYFENGVKVIHEARVKEFRMLHDFEIYLTIISTSIMIGLFVGMLFVLEKMTSKNPSS